MSVQLNNNIAGKLSSYRTKLLEWCGNAEEYLVNHASMMDEFSAHIQDVYELYSNSMEGSSTTDMTYEWDALAEKYVDPAHGIRSKHENFSFTGPDGTCYQFASDIDIDEQHPYILTIKKVNSDTDGDTTTLWTFDNHIDSMTALYQNAEYFDEALNAYSTTLTLNQIGKGLGDIYTSFSATTEATRQYLAGSLSLDSVENIMNNLAIGGSETCENLRLAFMNNFSSLTASPSSWLEGVKAILNQLVDATRSGNKFVFGIDTYEIGTSVVIGFQGIVSAITNIAGVITTIFNPIIGLAVSAIGSVVNKIAEVITENEADNIQYNEDSDIVCFGQNVFRSYAKLDDFDYTFDDYNSDVIQVVSPISNTLIYKNVKQNSLHQYIVPVQEFLVPFIPVTAAAYDALAGIFTTGNQVSVTSNWISDGGSRYYLQETYSVAGANTNSSATRRTYVKYFLTWMNEHPEAIHYCDENDSDDTIKIGVTFALALWKMLTVRPESPTYMSKTFTLNYLKAANFLNHVKDVDMEGNDFADYCFSFIRMMRSSISSVGAYDPELNVDFDTWLESVIYNTSSSYSMNGVQTYSWADLVNTVMTEDLAVAAVANDIFTAGSEIPNSILPIEAKSKYAVYMLPPKQSIKLWIRLALTIGIIVTTVAVAAIAFYTAKKKARRSFTQQCTSAKSHYDSWIETGSDSEYRAYRKSMRKANFAGKLFGFGTYDVANGWVNSSVSSTGGVVNTLLGANSQSTTSLSNAIGGVATTVATNTNNSLDNLYERINADMGDIYRDVYRDIDVVNGNVNDVKTDVQNVYSSIVGE